MGRRKVSVAVVCEDDMHRAFVVGYLREKKIERFRLVVAPKGQGSGKQFVNQQYPPELKGIRRHPKERRALAVVTDADELTVQQRERQLAEALKNAGVSHPLAEERVCVVIPKWSIETWIACMYGVEESENNKIAKRFEIAEAANAGTDLARLAPQTSAWGPSLVEGRARLAQFVQKCGPIE